MKCIKNYNNNPYFNIASEEYLLNNINDDCFMIWQNAPSVIVGKHQNTYSEINYDAVRRNNIDIVRRLSGGGAVYHDLGNINFTFITKQTTSPQVDFNRFIQPIINALNKHSIGAYSNKKNDILIDNMKISGNAQHIHKNKILHHGTLLFNTDINMMNKLLNTANIKYTDKSVKSISSNVTNISQYLKSNISINDFIEQITHDIIENYDDCTTYNLSQSDIDKINTLVQNKYSTWKWNYGYSPKYNFHNTINGNININLNVSDGIITDIKITGSGVNMSNISIFESILTNIPHSEEAIIEELKQINIATHIYNVSIDELLNGMF